MTELNFDFVDNLNGNSLANVLVRALRYGVPHGELLGQLTERPARLDIASAYFSPAGFAQIANHLEDLERIRLMIGAEPPRDAKPLQRRLDETEAAFQKRLIREGLDELDQGLRHERDHFPFTKAGRASLKKLIEVLRAGRMEARRYEKAFLHAKAYILSNREGADATGAGLFAGSSNLTRAGVTSNLELNLGRFDPIIHGQATAWFERLWDEAVPVDLAALFEEVFAEYTPWEIYLRVLWRIYGSEVAQEQDNDSGLPLTNFQKHGVARAMRLMAENGGAIVADEVGLGKTFIAGEILRSYKERRLRTLLICPAQLRDSTWAKFRTNNFLMDVECVSYEELAIDRQIAMADPNQFQDKLKRPLDEYQLVVVDEAHNYRNPDAPTRARVLRRLLWGQRRDVLLLTATPVNNSLWDLYNLIRYFIRQDSLLADRGILSIRERFEEAAREEPDQLSPDMLFPVIDATTVKRTRHFVKKHYGGDTITFAGQTMTIVFPEPKPITVRYPLAAPMPELFDLVEAALDPAELDAGNPQAMTFARYAPGLYPKRLDLQDQEERARASATVGLLRSGLLKRFESSTFAFGRTLAKLIKQHEDFLELLGQGHVVNTRFLKDLAATDDDVEGLLSNHDGVESTAFYDVPGLQQAVERDLATLRGLAGKIAAVGPQNDPKLEALVRTLKEIAAEAEAEASSEDDARQKRKVLIFSFFADTVGYLRNALADVARTDPELGIYAGRIVAVAGSVDVEEDEIGRRTAVEGFAPISSEAVDGNDRFDLLITTDVLAEGVNLQQCRHIINYDIPWNPMRMVQRHGRIDRIGSPHARVFLRTIFPADRLDALLNLEQRILQKIALAAASVGVVAPVEGAADGSQVFAETREEIERLLAEDPTLFERGLAGSAGQTGEEYRQTLRKALEAGGSRTQTLPMGIGSGMVKGKEQGVFFCASVGDRTYLRFIPCSTDWIYDPERPLHRELGRCLRIIECEPGTARHVPEALEANVFDLWEVARASVHEAWMAETDPANLQPKVRPLNLRVAEFIRQNPLPDGEAQDVQKALDILEAPWPRREELLLREWFANEAMQGAPKTKDLVRKINDSGLPPFSQPPVLPPITPNDVQLVCWMGIVNEAVLSATS
ncbi:helicase [Croceicoccus ponticola]|uniref:Helicase n=1 Tax=Croceicoccus ponticola TaxID=2217664 RepID=A0A437GX44_9SPHN|nr:helicase-related protein [Croceicoccus ponticola]RVQ66944.1 helicase [Croceicoccus ponticola]